MMYNGGTWVAVLQKKNRAAAAKDCHQRSIDDTKALVQGPED